MQFAFPMPNMSQLKEAVRPWEMAVTGPDQARMIKQAEDLGYDYVLVPEHMVVPQDHVELSGSHYFHTAAAQGFYLGASTRIRVGTGITILPLQHPIVTAKALSTIDWMSGGRVNVTFAAGWLQGEFEALGVPFNKRGRLMDEYLAAIVELWTKDVASFEGEFVNFKDMVLEPKGIQKPHIPIWMGGDADPVLKRMARFASGWVPFLTKPQDIPAKLDFIKSQPEYKGGDFAVTYMVGSSFISEGHVAGDNPIGRDVSSAQQMIDLIGFLRDCGVTNAYYAIPQVNNADEFMAYAQWFMEEVKPHFA